MKNKVYIFDLDDTLYKEIEFLNSGFDYISRYISKFEFENIFNEMVKLYYEKKNVFNFISRKYKIEISVLFKLYREHQPNIFLDNDSRFVLTELVNTNKIVGLITDGRSITQRNKIKALNIENYFDLIIISEEFGTEKPCINNFKIFEQKFKMSNYIYIGDNTSKDFISPDFLNWNTFCLLDNGFNIHKQDLSLLPTSTKKIKKIDEIL